MLEFVSNFRDPSNHNANQNQQEGYMLNSSSQQRNDFVYPDSAEYKNKW